MPVNNLSITMITLLASYAFGMSIGQVLFKYAAIKNEGSFLNFIFVPYFWLGIMLFGLMIVLWMYIISQIPLSLAYPVIALVFVITPLLAAFLFGESLEPSYLLGMGLILSGLFVILR